MNLNIPRVMRAAAIEEFGGPEVLHVMSLPVPKPAPDEVLIRLDTAGIGVWDPFVRRGELELGSKGFPQVIGSDGAGMVVAVGKRARRFKPGDHVYAFDYNGGFYAEFVAVPEDDAAPVPPGLDPRQAGALGADGITALRGLEDELELESGEGVVIFGASGGVGHIAVQLAKRIGASVFAVASGPDGVALVKRLGADAAADGRHDDVLDAIRRFAPRGMDAALVLASDKDLGALLMAVRPGGRVAYPNGVEPEPAVPEGCSRHVYDGTPSREAFERLNDLIGSEAFHVELGHVYRLEEAASAHRDLHRHHLGKLAFDLHAS
jgi:NADPH:quinone reductase